MPAVRQLSPCRLFPVISLSTLVSTIICFGAANLPVRSKAQSSDTKPGIISAGRQIEAQSAGLRFAPQELWVKKLALDLEAPRPLATDSGMYLRLHDQQFHVEKHARYSRYADEFVSIAGLHEQAEVIIEFDPAYQTLSVHEVVLHRHGRTIDVLAEARSLGLIRLLTPEDELDEKVLSGHRQLLLMVPGARVGDVLDYSYTVSGRPPFFGNAITDHIVLQRAEPVQQIHYRMLKSSKRDLFWKSHPPHSAPEIKALEPKADSKLRLQQLIWQQRNIQPVFAEPDIPAWYHPAAFVQISSFASWQEVARLGRALYDFAEQPLPEDLRDRISELRVKHPTPQAQARAAVRLVQDEIRYLAITDGAAAYQPDPPATTWKRQFGDCKNKTALLKRILGELEIDSTAVFVDLDATPRGFEWLPTPSATVFDHVILRIDFVGGKTAWADSTVSLERGPLATTDPGDFFVGLPLCEDTTALVKFPTEIIHETLPHRHTVETFQLGDIGKATRLSVNTTYRHSLASEKRHFLAFHHPSLVQRSHTQFYQQNFPNLEFPLEPTKTEDNPDTGELKFRQNYQLGEIWQQDPSDEGYYSVYLYFDSIRSNLNKPRKLERSMPFSLGPPRHFQHTCIVRLPANQDWEFDDEDHFIEQAGLRFSRSVRQDGQQLRIDLNLSNADDHILPGQLGGYAEAVDDIFDLCHYSIWRLDDKHQAARSSEKSPDSEPPTEDGDSQWPSRSTLTHIIELTVICVLSFLGAKILFRRK